MTDTAAPSTFPPVARIDPMSPAGTLKVDYVVVTQRYFNARQKRALECAVLDRLGPGSTVRLTASSDRVVVRAQPADALSGFGSFAVFGVLRELFTPTAPHSALGVLLGPVLTAGRVRVGMMLMGHPTGPTVDLLREKILTLPYVPAVEVVPDSLQQLVLTVDGPWQQTLPTLREDLIPTAGIASTLKVDSRR